MIAPEPALAGARPAAKPREAARDPEPEKARGGDFDSVLKEQPERGEAAAAVLPDTVPDVPDMAAVIAVPPIVPPAVSPVVTPAVASVVAPAVAPVVEQTAAVAAPALPAALAPPPVPAAVPLVALAASDGQPLEAEAPVMPAAEEPAAGKATLTAAPRVAPDVVAPRGQVEAAPPVERREAAEAPPDAAPGREPVRAGRAPADPAVRAGQVESVAPATLRDAAAPVWHLAADPGQGLARSEALAAPHVAHAPAPASPVVQAQAVVGQLAVAVGRASDDTVEIRLDPPELGRVQIHLTRTDGGVQAVVLADRAETQDLLRRHAGELAHELGQAGYDSVSLDFGGGEAQSGRDGAAMDWFEEAPAVSVSAAAAAAPIAAPRRSLAGGLDVRL